MARCFGQRWYALWCMRLRRHRRAVWRPRSSLSLLMARCSGSAGTFSRVCDCGGTRTPRDGPGRRPISGWRAASGSAGTLSYVCNCCGMSIPHDGPGRHLTTIWLRAAADSAGTLSRAYDRGGISVTALISMQSFSGALPQTALTRPLVRVIVAAPSHRVTTSVVSSMLNASNAG